MKPSFKYFSTLLTIGLLAICVLGAAVIQIDQLANKVSDPQLLTIDSTTPVTVFTNNPSRSNGRVLLRVIQNVGTAPFLYRINSTNVSVLNYHGVVSGGQTNRDGLGSILDLSKVSYPVSLITESGTTTVSVVELQQ